MRLFFVLFNPADGITSWLSGGRSLIVVIVMIKLECFTIGPQYPQVLYCVVSLK
jgi:hypothetical protein